MISIKERISFAEELKKTKFNITSVETFRDKRSRYSRFFSFETCDICKKQGIKFEVIKYSGLFDLNMIRQAIPYREYDKVKPYFSFTNTIDFIYVLFYTCSEDCNNMLVLQQMGC